MNSFFTGTELFNTNNISIRELNKFNYLKDPLNLQFNQSNVRLNAKNTNNNNFFNDYIIKKLDPIPNSNHKQRISSSNYYLDLIDISHKSNNTSNKQYSRESPLLNDKDLNGTLGSIPLDKIVLENTMAVEKNIVNMSNSEYIARKLQSDENTNNIDSIMTLDVLNTQLESNYQKRLDIALQTTKRIPVKINKPVSDNLIETESIIDDVDDFVEHQKKMRQLKRYDIDVDDNISIISNEPISLTNTSNKSKKIENTIEKDEKKIEKDEKEYNKKRSKIMHSEDLVNFHPNIYKELVKIVLSEKFISKDTINSVNALLKYHKKPIITKKNIVNQDTLIKNISQNFLTGITIKNKKEITENEKEKFFNKKEGNVYSRQDNPLNKS